MTAPTLVSRFVASRSSAQLGILIMLLGNLLFGLNDVMGKWLVSTYSVGQVLLIRSAVALVVLSPFLWKAGLRPLLSLERPGLQLLRVVVATIEVCSFYYAVITLPLADVITYWLAAPIYVAALSPIFLGEKVGWRRWTAICVGFVGVIVALEPSAAAFTAPALISIVGSFCFALMILISRALRSTPDTTFAFWQLLGGAAFGLATVPFGWVTPSAIDFGLLALLGVVSMIGHMCINRSLKLADAATVTPYQYTLLFWGVIFGWMFFGDVPRPAMALGAAIIVASGLFIFLREQQLKRRAQAEKPGTVPEPSPTPPLSGH